MYKVIKNFTDLKDNNHEYQANDYYPHAGRNIEDIPEERIKELSTENNRRGEILIEEIKETPEDKKEEKSKQEETPEDKKEEKSKQEETPDNEKGKKSKK